MADLDHTGNLDAVHPDPVWGDRADFLIGAPLPEPGRSEQLWARRVEEHRFEICCIPFFATDVALGDLVETDSTFDLVRVLLPSGRFVFRVWFGDSPEMREASAGALAERGALLEWSSANLLAVDARDLQHAEAIAAFLAERERAGKRIYETGRS